MQLTRRAALAALAVQACPPLAKAQGRPAFTSGGAAIDVERYGPVRAGGGRR